MSKSKNRILKMDCEGCEYDAILLSSKELLQILNKFVLVITMDTKIL